jgi:outer membrane protein TolC
MQNSKFSSNILFLVVIVCFLPAIVQAQQLDSALKELISKGLEKSHSLNIYDFDIEQTKVDQQLAKSIFLPKITLNASYTRLDDDITFDNATKDLLIATQKLLIKEAVGVPFNNVSPTNIPLEPIPNLQDKSILKSSMDVNWVLFSGLEATNAIKASKHKEASLNYLTRVEADKIVLEIIEVYDRLALVNASKKVLQTTENYLAEQEYYVNTAIKNGLATPIDRKRIELAKQQLASKLLEFEHSKTLLVEVLHQLTNENRRNLRLLDPALQSFAFDSVTTAKKRSELKALEEAKKATLFKVKMEKSNFIPKLAFKGHYEFIEDDLSLFDPQWFAGIGIKWNVFDGNQSRLKSKKTILESQKYQEQIDDANEMINLNIIKTELTYESTIQNIEMVQKEIEISRDTYDMINKHYKNNLSSINDVLDALNEFEKSNFKLQQSYFNQRRAVTALLHAKGILKY